MTAVVTQKQVTSDLRLRIVVVRPPAGVQFQLQRGTRDLEPPARRTDTAITFEFVVRVGTRPDGRPISSARMRRARRPRASCT